MTALSAQYVVHFPVLRQFPLSKFGMAGLGNLSPKNGAWLLTLVILSFLGWQHFCWLSISWSFIIISSYMLPKSQSVIQPNMFHTLLLYFLLVYFLFFKLPFPAVNATISVFENICTQSLSVFLRVRKTLKSAKMIESMFWKIVLQRKRCKCNKNKIKMIIWTLQGTLQIFTW